MSAPILWLSPATGGLTSWEGAIYMPRFTRCTPEPSRPPRAGAPRRLPAPLCRLIAADWTTPS